MQMLQLNKKGIFPKAKEEERAFLLRAERCLDFQNQVKIAIESKLLPIDASEDNLIPIEHFKTSLDTTEKLFDVRPDWAPIFYTRSLCFWVGGRTTLLSFNGQDPLPIIELQKELKGQKQLFNLYSMEEIASHELLHAARCNFDSSHFEEIIAFSSSPRKYRRYFGPLFSEEWEACALLASAAFGTLGGALSKLTMPDLLSQAAYTAIQASPLFIIGGALARLAYRQNVWNKALQKIALTSTNAHAIIFRLSDAEIYALAGGSTLQNLADGSLRWEVIRKAYGV